MELKQPAQNSLYSDPRSFLTDIKTARPFSRLFAMAFLCLGLHAASAVSVEFHQESHVPIVAESFGATGQTIDITLNYPPRTGTELMLMENTGIDFIDGTFNDLAQGQTVSLEYDGVTYDFVANYFGGTGNDLVLMWKNVRAVGWGVNSNGELGDGTFTSRAEPAPVSANGVLAGKTVISLATGLYHSLALCSDGTLVAWGIGYYGNLGNGSTALSKVPVAVDTTSAMSALSGKTVIGVTAGNFHCLALCSDGTLAAWGANFAGQLGDGTETNRSLPVRIDSGVLAGKKVVGMAAGTAHSLALCSDGTVAAWGSNQYGQLGDNSWDYQRNLPVAVNTAPGTSALYDKAVTQLAAGGSSSLALCSDGSVAMWGIGVGQGSGERAPMAVTMPVPVSALAAGDLHWLALSQGGGVYAWGSGTGSAVPTLVYTSAVGIAAGFGHSLALSYDGTLFTWGGGGIVNGFFEHMIEVGIRFSKLQSGESRHYSLALAAYPNAQAVRRDWRQQMFGSDPANSGIAADDADPDQDGLPNLMEYALNLDPNAFTPAPMELQPAGSDLEYRYSRSGIAHAAGVTYRVEWSDDLSIWSTTGVIEEMIDNGVTRQEMKATLPAGNCGRRFVRLRVE